MEVRRRLRLRRGSDPLWLVPFGLEEPLWLFDVCVLGSWEEVSPELVVPVIGAPAAGGVGLALTLPELVESSDGGEACSAAEAAVCAPALESPAVAG